jgi:hypothetical protein
VLSAEAKLSSLFETTAQRFWLQAAQLQSLRNSQQAGSSSSSSSNKPQVLLELMLLQAEPSGAPGAGMQSLFQQAAFGSLALGSSYGSLQDDATAAAADAAGGDAGADGDVELLVLVSAASNVPLVPG